MGRSESNWEITMIKICLKNCQRVSKNNTFKILFSLTEYERTNGFVEKLRFHSQGD